MKGQEGLGRSPQGTHEPPWQEAETDWLWPVGSTMVQTSLGSLPPSQGHWVITEPVEAHGAGAPCKTEGAQRNEAKPGPHDGAQPAQQRTGSEAGQPVQSPTGASARLTSRLVAQDGPSAGSPAAGLTPSVCHVTAHHQRRRSFVHSLNSALGQALLWAQGARTAGGDRARTGRVEGRRAQCHLRHRHQELPKHEPRREGRATRGCLSEERRRRGRQWA